MVHSQKTNQTFLAFTPAIYPKSLKDIKVQVREVFKNAGTHTSIEKLSSELNQKLRGWFNYYGRFNRSATAKIAIFFDHRLMQWAGHKYVNLFRSRTQRWKWLKHRFKERPRLFVHWQIFPVSLSGAG